MLPVGGFFTVDAAQALRLDAPLQKPGTLQIAERPAVKVSPSAIDDTEEDIYSEIYTGGY